MAARINAYFIKISLCCENYGTVVVETVPIPIPRYMLQAASLALLPIFKKISKLAF